MKSEKLNEHKQKRIFFLKPIASSLTLKIKNYFNKIKI